MATVRTDRDKKLVVVVNTGTEESPTLKNRPIGNYWINPNTDVATDTKLYQLGQYFGALQAHTVSKITAEERGKLVQE